MGNRTTFAVTVTQKGPDDIYTTEWDGQTLSAVDPSELNRLLDEAGAPRPRYFDASRKDA